MDDVFVIKPSQILNVKVYSISIILTLGILYLLNIDIAQNIENITYGYMIDYKLITIDIDKFNTFVSYGLLALIVIIGLNAFLFYLIVSTTEYRFYSGGKRLDIRKGILSQKTDAIFVGNVVDIDINNSLLERLFGLGTLTLYTSGDLSKNTEGLTPREKHRLDEINSNVVMHYMSIKKIKAVKEFNEIKKYIQGF